MVIPFFLLGGYGAAQPLDAPPLVNRQHGKATGNSYLFSGMKCALGTYFGVPSAHKRCCGRANLP